MTKEEKFAKVEQLLVKIGDMFGELEELNPEHPINYLVHAIVGENNVRSAVISSYCPWEISPQLSILAHDLWSPKEGRDLVMMKMFQFNRENPGDVKIVDNLAPEVTN